jgi:hypothetical protein
VRGRRLRGPPAALGARRARREPGPGADDPGGGTLSYAGPRGRSKCIIATSRSASTSPRPTISSSTSSPGSDGGLAR